MKNLYQFCRRTSPLSAIVCSMVGLVCTNASASSINYTFTQTGFVDQAGDGGVLNGTFTATPESNGLIQQQDLTAFQATFKETVNNIPDSFVFNILNDFSYDTTSPGSLEFSAGSAASGIQLCSGGNDTNFVCFGLSPTGGARANASGFFQDAPNFGVSLTRLGPQVSIAASPVATPEPATCALLGTAGGALLMVGALKRRSRQRLPVRLAVEGH
jgi:hypothetical protein